MFLRNREGGKKDISEIEISLEVVLVLPQAGNVYKTPPKADTEVWKSFPEYQRATAMGNLQGVYWRRVNFLKFQHPLHPYE